jgi:hypothetical protein
MRGGPSPSQGLLQSYETALQAGEGPLIHAIATALPDETVNPELSSGALASYLIRLERQPFATLQAGSLDFPEPSEEP